MSEERPWEAYAKPNAPTGERPWEAYAPPGASARPAEAPSGAPLDYADIGKGAAGGLGRGVAGTIGLPGTIGNAMRWGAGQLGVPENVIDAGAKAARYIPQLQMFTGPDAGQVQRTMEGATGKFYEPKTVPGQYASTLAEFAPGAFIPGGGGIGARVLNTVVPALTSETAGQLTKGTAAEPWARGIFGVGGGLAASRVVTPFATPNAQRAADIAVLQREGIPLSAGERTGSKALKWMESVAGDMPMSSGIAAARQEATANAYNRAVTERMFDRGALTARGVPEDLNLPNPQVRAEGQRTLSDSYTDLSARNQLHTGPTLQRDLANAQTRYERLVPPSQRTQDIEQLRNDITNRLIQGQGRISGQEYQALRSQLGTLARDNRANTYLSRAYDDMQTALDNAMWRRLSPADRAAWDLTNQRWANMKQFDPAIAQASEHLSPQVMKRTARIGRTDQYAAGRGNMDELVAAADRVLKPLPNSGTAPRTAYQSLFSIPSTLAQGAVGGATLGPLGIAAAVAPHLAGAATVSRLGQRYLGNQALPQNNRDIIAQTLASQAVSQPSGIDRNAAAQAAYEQERQRDLIARGLAPPRPGYRVTRENGATRVVPIN